MKHSGIITSNLDVSSLAKITHGYTMGHIDTACQQVLTERRVANLNKKHLMAVEFVAPLARIDPVYKEEEEAFKVGLSGILASEIFHVFALNGLVLMFSY